MFSHWSRPKLGLATHAVQEVVHHKPNLATTGCVIASYCVDNPCCPFASEGKGNLGVQEIAGKRQIGSGWMEWMDLQWGEVSSLSSVYSRKLICLYYYYWKEFLLNLHSLCLSAPLSSQSCKKSRETSFSEWFNHVAALWLQTLRHMHCIAAERCWMFNVKHMVTS